MAMLVSHCHYEVNIVLLYPNHALREKYVMSLKTISSVSRHFVWI